MKDYLLSKGLKLILSSHIERYGSISDAKMDSEKKKIVLRLLLKGEADEIDVVVEKYTVVLVEEESHIRIDEMSAHKEWITLALNDFASGKSFPINSIVAKII